MADSREEAIKRANEQNDPAVAWKLFVASQTIDMGGGQAPRSVEPAPTIEVRYHEVSLDDVLRYFVNGYELQDSKVVGHDAFVDMSKRAVVFRLTVEKSDPGELSRS